MSFDLTFLVDHRRAMGTVFGGAAASVNKHAPLWSKEQAKTLFPTRGSDEFESSIIVACRHFEFDC